MWLLGPVCLSGDYYLCFVYVHFVIVWLSVLVQLIAWKDSALKWPVMCRAGH